MESGFSKQTRIPSVVFDPRGSRSVERILSNALALIESVSEWPESERIRAEVTLDDLEFLIERVHRG